MTFGAGNRAMRSIDPRPKCGGEKPHKGRSPTAVFRSPSRYCGEAYTVLLGDVCGEYMFLLFLLFQNIVLLEPSIFSPISRPPTAMDGGGRGINASYFVLQ